MAAENGRGTLYEGIADDLKKRIRAGEFAPGASLGTLPQLQRRYGAAQNTIREALKVLAREDLVTTLAGKGTFVTGTRPAAGTILDRLAGLEQRADQAGELEKRVDELEVQVMELRAADGMPAARSSARSEAQ